MPASWLTEKLTLRVLLAAAVASALSCASLLAAETKPEAYAKDVEFLLAELEQKAGRFFLAYPVA